MHVSIDRHKHVQPLSSPHIELFLSSNAAKKGSCFFFFLVFFGCFCGVRVRKCIYVCTRRHAKAGQPRLRHGTERAPSPVLQNAQNPRAKVSYTRREQLVKTVNDVCTPWGGRQPHARLERATKLQRMRVIERLGYCSSARELAAPGLLLLECKRSQGRNRRHLKLRGTLAPERR